MARYGLNKEAASSGRNTAFFENDLVTQLFAETVCTDTFQQAGNQ